MNDASKYMEQGTGLSGYEEHGPYHCEDCRHLATGQDREAERGLCAHPIVALDPKLTHPTKSTTDVSLERGCCKFVSQPARDADEDIPARIRRGKIS